MASTHNHSNHQSSLKQDPTKTDEKKPKGKTFTYVGAGESSPRKINFMGKQEFVRGKAVEVTDENLIKKIEGNPTFVEGQADEETLARIDEEGEEEAETQRRQDAKTNALYTKQHKTPGKGEE